MALATRRAMVFSLPAFGTGLGVITVFYALLAGWLWYEAPLTLARQQNHLESATAAVGAMTQVANEPTPTSVAVTGQAMASVPAISVPVTPVAGPTSLAVAPLQGLFETTPAGRLPIIRPTDGLTPFKAYRRPFNRATAKGPIVSIVIADLGLSAASLQSALGGLPADISFDVSPYANAADTLVAEARAKGHEVWLTLPMESSGYPRIDAGPQTLLIGASPQQNRDKMLTVLGRAVGYAGVVTSADPVFLKSAGDMQPVVAALYDRGLGFVDTSDTPDTRPQTMALPKNGAYASVDIWLDAKATPDDIRVALAQLEQKARAKGSAAGIIHPWPVSIREVSAWTAGLNAKGLVLAPLSAQTGQ